MARPRQSAITAEITAVRRSIAGLDQALHRLAASVRGGRSGGSTASPRRKLTLTPERKAALKLQGQYMGYLRNLKPKQKAGVKALKEKKGIRAAIAAAKRMGKAA